MKNFILLALCLFTFDAQAAYKPYAQDPKWPSNKSIEYQLIENPAAASTGYYKIAQASSSTTETLVTSFLHLVDVARNVTITSAGVATDLENCTITVSGKNMLGASITEDFSVTANTSVSATGSKAFKSLTSISIPAACQSGAAGATFSIGMGEKLGVSRCLDNAGDILFSLYNGAKEGTAPTMVIDNDEVEKNTADFNGTMDGSADFVLYFMQNYRCIP